MTETATYPSGLRLAGRRVVVVGGGHVAHRRVPALVGTGADVVIVSPHIDPALEAIAAAGEVEWRQKRFDPADLDGAWYVVAATNDAAANDAVSTAAEARRTFCVRSDDASRGTAWTPAVGRHDGVTVAVLGDQREVRDPRRTAALRDDIVRALEDDELGSSRAHPGAGVTLVGGGPGDPALITVAGRAALRSADVVIADRLAPRELLGDLPADVDLIDVAKLPRGRSAKQVEINRLVVEHARAGKRVVRFKGGDNFVFGRGYEEVIACREAGVPVTVVPGLSSPIAVPGLAGIPVTHRGVTHEFTIISGHLPPGDPESLVDWPSVAGSRGTVILMMAVHNAPEIAAVLLEGARGPETPVGIVCDGSMPTERVVLTTLGDLTESLTREEVRPPAIIVIGEVVAVAHPEHYGRG